MSNPLEHALVPVARGKVRSGGVDLIAGEVVKEFWTWPKYIQDVNTKDGKVVLLSPEAARISMAKAAEIRVASQLKEEKAEINGVEAQLAGVRELLEALEDQRNELIAKGESLMDQLEEMRAEVTEKGGDPGLRPADAESEALNVEPKSDIEEATGLKLNKAPPEPEPESEPDGPPAPSDAPERSPEDILGDAEVARIRAWAKGQNYRELQSSAKQLELKAFGMKHAELLELVLDAILAKESKKFRVANRSEEAGDAGRLDDENEDEDEDEGGTGLLSSDGTDAGETEVDEDEDGEGTDQAEA